MTTRSKKKKKIFRIKFLSITYCRFKTSLVRARVKQSNQLPHIIPLRFWLQHTCFFLRASEKSHEEKKVPLSKRTRNRQYAKEEEKNNPGFVQSDK